MNVEALPSDYLIDFRNRFREFFAPGSTVTQAKFDWAIKRMNSAVALSQEAEEDARVIEHQLKANRDNLRNRRAAVGITDIISSSVTQMRARAPK
jgi:hypothetical protein